MSEKIMNYCIVAADVSLTLMVINADGDYFPTDVRTYQYYILALETFASNLDANAKRLMIEVYNEHYNAFRMREPNDLNYIAVVGVAPKILTPDEYASKPWLMARMPVWESSNCIAVQNDGYRKVAPNSFGDILGLADKTQKQIGAKAAVRISANKSSDRSF
jgi:hypothetical protein